MAQARREDASFRDPAGHVYRIGDRVLRSVTDFGAPAYELVRDSGFLSGLIAENQVVNFEEVSPCLLGTETANVAYLLEHPTLSFISYPYEWCFSALQSAALLQLDLLRQALKHGITLSDASAFNIQFQGPNPIFIDVLSFQRYQEGDYWTAHQQFCAQFLNPLLLTAKRGVPFNAWFRGSLEGLRSEDLNQLLSWTQKLDWRVLTHVTLPVRFQSSARNKIDADIGRVKALRLPRQSFEHMVSGLRNWIAELKPSKKLQSAWRDYATDNSYDAAAAETKADFTRRFASSVKPAMLFDVGCNTGVYAEIALQAGAAEVIGFDTDIGAVEAAFARATDKNLRFFPLLIDAANPSPGQGWFGTERKSLAARANADGLIAYAVLHHLVIGRNIPLAEAVTWLIGLAPEGVIEFVEKEDPMIRRMLQLRDDIFPDYRRDNFLAAVQNKAEIVETKEIIEMRRMLLWYRRVPD